MAREDKELRGRYAEVDLSSLVDASSPIQKLVVGQYLRFIAKKQFTEVLSTRTSVRTIEINFQYLYCSDFLGASARNPFLHVHVRPGLQEYREEIEKLMLARRQLMSAFARIIGCLTTLRTIYLARDRGLFAMLPDEILMLIWQETFNLTLGGLISQTVRWDLSQIKKLIRIASDRTKISASESDTVTRLQSLWSDEELCNLASSNNNSHQP